MIDTRFGRRDRWIRLIGAPVGAPALVGLAAYGTSTDTSASAAASASAEVSAGDAGDAPGTERAAYQSCLEENGVSMPERPDGGNGTPRRS